MAALVHHGLVVAVKLTDLRHIPKSGNVCDYDHQDIIGPLVGAFDMHMIPKWFSIAVENDFSDKLFTVSSFETPRVAGSIISDLLQAFFINDDELVLEHFDDPCKYLNIDLLSNAEDRLTVNHCNARSKAFITSLTESLLTCRMFVGNLLVLSAMINDGVPSDCSSNAKVSH